jgi:hypothetical protein
MTRNQARRLWFYLTNQNEDAFWTLNLKTPNTKNKYSQIVDEDIPVAVKFLREFADALEGKNDSN